MYIFYICVGFTVAILLGMGNAKALDGRMATEVPTLSFFYHIIISLMGAGRGYYRLRYALPLNV